MIMIFVREGRRNGREVTLNILDTTTHPTQPAYKIRVTDFSIDNRTALAQALRNSTNPLSLEIIQGLIKKNGMTVIDPKNGFPAIQEFDSAGRPSRQLRANGQTATLIPNP
jgi:hypothetical protein